MLALLWLLLLLPLVAGLLAEQRVREEFARFRRVPNRLRVTGAQVARALLDAQGLHRVRIEMAPGALTDHYDGVAGVLRLSPPVATEASVAALAIAAHEACHAYQDAAGSRAYRIRKAIGEPLAALAPFSWLFFLGGFWFGIPLLMAASIAYVAGLVAFALATLPVELGASRRALDLVSRSGLTDPAETAAVRTVLRAAALTYLAGLLRQVGLFSALILVAEMAREVATG